MDTKEYEEQVKDAEKKASKFGDSLKTGLGNAAKFAAKAGVAAVAAAAGAVVAVGKQAVDAYSEYEQLVGGIETLFGAGGQSLSEYAKATGQTMEQAVGEHKKLVAAQNEVMRNASKAYKTAGMSANQYMETVTSFSASLIQSLDGDTGKAAQYADMAITDMSDNANKMGTDISAIQNAYQGFAKQNYTMLDNLKLGYGGTKTEMERLIMDAEKLDKSFKASRDSNGDLTMSYADVVDAIHIVQDEMGITGTTAKEASTTIQGSIDSMKAAWQNWLTGLADENADIEELTTQLFESIETVAGNLLPVIENVLANIGAALQAKLPELVSGAITFIATHLPDMLAAGIQLLQALIDGISQGFATLYTMIEPWIQENIIQPAQDKIQEVVDLGKQIVDNIKEGISSAWDSLVGWFNGIWDSLFGHRSVSVSLDRSGGDYYAIGVDNVPYNGFPAMLHKGEAVLTAHEAEEWRRGGSGASSQPIQVQVSAPVMLDGAVIARQSYDFLIDLNNAHGPSLINA